MAGEDRGGRGLRARWTRSCPPAEARRPALAGCWKRRSRRTVGVACVRIVVGLWALGVGRTVAQPAQCPDTPCAEGTFCTYDAGATGTCKNCTACDSCYLCGLTDDGASDCNGECNPRCPEYMYAPPESGRDSFLDCQCVDGAVTRRFDLEGCSFYDLEHPSGCHQDGLERQDLGKADRPADCMQLVLSDTVLCTRRDFFMWEEQGDQTCYCPGGATAGGVSDCDFTNPAPGQSFDLVRAVAATYVIRGSGTSCFSSTHSLCELCTAGKYANQTDGGFNTASCVDCPAGTYSSNVGSNNSSMCTPCGAGHYSESVGALTNLTCTPCSAGKFSSQAVASACTSCDAGLYSEETGAISNATCLQVSLWLSWRQNHVCNCRRWQASR
jgi:hypothetical protein